MSNFESAGKIPHEKPQQNCILKFPFLEFDLLKEDELGGSYGSRRILGWDRSRGPRRAIAGGGSGAPDAGAGGVPGRVRAGVCRPLHRQR